MTDADLGGDRARRVATPIMGPLHEPSTPAAADIGGDPYQALDALMVVIEALCPVWPARRPAAASARFVL